MQWVNALPKRQQTPIESTAIGHACNATIVNDKAEQWKMTRMLSCRPALRPSSRDHLETPKNFHLATRHTERSAVR